MLVTESFVDVQSILVYLLKILTHARGSLVRTEQPVLTFALATGANAYLDSLAKLVKQASEFHIKDSNCIKALFCKICLVLKSAKQKFKNWLHYFKLVLNCTLNLINKLNTFDC